MSGVSYCPAEILHLVFSLLPPTEWRTLCLVNRKFRASAEPLLYSQVEWSWKDHHEPPSIIPFILSVTQRPELASYVKSLKLEGRSHSNLGYWPSMVPIPVSEPELEHVTAFIQKTGVPYSDLWIQEIRKGVTDAVVSLLIAQLSNLRFLDIEPVFLRRTTIIGMVLSSAICEPGKYRLPDFREVRDVSVIFREGWDAVRVAEKFQETADLLPLFYLSKLEHLAVSIRSTSAYKWPTESLPHPSRLKSLDLRSIRETHLIDIIPLARQLENLAWEYYYDFDLKGDFNQPMVDLDQIAAALSHAPPTLADIKIEAAVGIGGHDISYPGVSIKGSLKKMADLHQIKKLQIPFVFLVGFVQDTMKRLQDSLPRNIELLTLTYDLTEQEDQFNPEMPEWDWEDEAIFDLLQSWLNVWESCTPCLREIRIVQIPEEEMGVWDSTLIERLNDLSIRTGIQIELSPVK
jgi:hypothetical protein